MVSGSSHGLARAKRAASSPSPALFTHYRANILGTTGQTYINALVRLKGGAAAIPAFRADLARVTGRSDIDVWNNLDHSAAPSSRSPGTRPPACSPSRWRRWWPRSS